MKGNEKGNERKCMEMKGNEWNMNGKRTATEMK